MMSRFNRLPSLRRGAGAGTRQRGAATLIVVMVLFFVMSLVAAYSSRNIIFEQRTSANQYTSMVSLEAANAGLEWALGLLNGSRIDDNCAPSTSPANASFRQRYLQVDPTSGAITVPNAVRDGPMWPTCWHNRNTNQWVCHCPAGAGGAIATTPTDSFAPSFRVRFIQFSDALPSAVKPGIVAIEVNGCTGWDAACLNFQPFANDSCKGTVCAQLALSSGLKSPPTAAITARQSIGFSGSPVTAANTDPGTTGFTVIGGGSVATAGMTLLGPPGMPVGLTWMQNDLGLSNALFTPERMFAALFGSWPSTYMEQPGAVKVNCAAPCNSTTVRNAVEANPGRVFVLQGDVALDGGASIGTATDPVVLLVTGSFSFAAPTDVYGVVYSRAATWTTAGTGRIEGAAVGENAIGGNGSFTVVRSREVLERLRWGTGSFVMVPGSWKDFP
jgi:Tfp pilus assembly protein PilX